MAANLYAIPAGSDFAGTLARGVIARLDDPRDPLALATVTIFLPTRRATRVLVEAFAGQLGGAALLPQIRALGDDDDEEFLFDADAEDIELPPAIDPIRRRLLLGALVRRWEHRRGGRPGLARAAAMAQLLARFLDEVAIHQVDLDQLRGLAPDRLAEHWREVCDFLLFLRENWPRVLAEEGTIDRADRRNRVLRNKARDYRTRKPQDLVIAAGTTGSIPATSKLLRAIAELPRGAIVLPALDREMDDESWAALEPGHPQYGMRQLLTSLGISRSEVENWDRGPCTESGRSFFLREALRPPPTTDAWQELAQRQSAVLACGLDGLLLAEAANPGEEALAIALMLREALETRDKKAALVTPDRELARRVASELRRWDIAIDDSAGVPLAHTPPGVFLCLLADAAAQSFAPVPLLALLKHPLAAGGEVPADFRRYVRLLDRFVLRGARPDPGFAGVQRAIASAKDERGEKSTGSLLTDLSVWFSRVAGMLQPFADAIASPTASLARVVKLHWEAAERLAESTQSKGRSRLWEGEDGEAAAALMEGLSRAGEDYPEIEPSAYSLLLRQFMDEQAVRPAFGRHPRLSILGPLEARLHQFDMVVLGGLNEGTWPRSASADPWLSRPMRERLGLDSPERAIGLAAHDFATLAHAPDVRLTRAIKVDGVPTVASRWLQRVQQLASGIGQEERLSRGVKYTAYARLYAAPVGEVSPIAAPAPRPPVSERPRELSVTEIEIWLRDPYAIYARRVLRLRRLDPLDAEVGPLDRGRIMHDVLERFVAETQADWPLNAAERLIALADEAFAQYSVPKVALALWRPRFVRAARWFVDEERRRREEIVRSWLEVEGRIAIAGPVGPFVLKGRADRIDMLHQGGGAVVDYKTGKPPTDPQVAKFSQQLPLEGAILEGGGYAEIGAVRATELVYIRFSGGPVPGETHIVPGAVRTRIAQALDGLSRRIAQFDCADTPYLSRIAPYRADMAGDYDHLARVREWSLSGWAEE